MDPRILADFASDSAENVMPAGSPAPFQLDATPPPSRWNAKPVHRAVRSKLALGAVAVALALCSRPGMAAPALAVIDSSGVGRAWLPPILCGGAGLIAFLILRAAVRLARTVFTSSSIRVRKGEIASTSVERFVVEAQRLHIDPQIARETIQLLASLLPVEMPVDVNDELRGTLSLSDEQIDSLLSTLPGLFDRSGLPANAASILSVYDLLHYIESLPKSKSGQFYTQTGLSVQKAVPTLASPLADLKNASPRDSRFCTRAHFSGVKRRASDYSGPYRRATDRRPDEDYGGPLRRASDRQNVGSVTLDSRVVDRRSSERRTVISPESPDQARQHRAVSADTSLLNQCVGVSNTQPSSETDRERMPTPGMDKNVATPTASLQRA